MFLRNRIRLFVYTALMALAVAACTAAGNTDPTAVEDEVLGHSVFTFGSPGQANDADRTIEVSANDDLTFSPAEIVVSTGETITFVVSNTGQVVHDFTLGDQTAQDDHEEEMAEMMESGDMTMHDEDNVVVLQPGETKELTWNFTESGTFLIGCHQPGHYAGGMKATIDVD
ncbi:MAG: copper-binding protein [Acidobacteria bacterium]|nr:MAG: copper-binding protein [Acidobacteriota bacterium]